VFAGLVALGAFLGFHATPIAIALEVSPAYKTATEAARSSLVISANTFAQFCQLLNYFGDALVWGVTTSLFAIAALRTSAAPRWICWVGIVAAVFAGRLVRRRESSETAPGA
jgi:hypothetical protein